MKKVFFILAAIFAFGFMAQAQEDDTKKDRYAKFTAEQRAEKRTKKITKELSLTEAQIPQVKAIQLEFEKAAQKAYEAANGNTEALKATIKPLRKAKRQKMKEVLTEEQLALGKKKIKAGWKSLPAEKRAELVSTKLKEELKLTDEQFGKVKGINLEFEKQAQTVYLDSSHKCNFCGGHGFASFLA